MTNALANVKGTVQDNWQVASVWCQLNNGVWSAAASTNGWTNWTAVLALEAGTNVIKAYAVDLGGNASTTNSVSFVSPNAFTMRLSCYPAQTLTSDGLGLTVNVSTGLTCRIQISTNLLSWVTWTNFFASNSTINLVDLVATNCPRRFYRAVIP